MEDNTFDDFEENFKCPVCLELPQKEIFQCKNGHTICDDCIKNLKECPQCRLAFGHTQIRNRALETVLDKMRFDCQFKSKGCEEKMARSEIINHSESCSFGNDFVKLCQHLGYTCDFPLNPKKLQAVISHLHEEHQILISQDIKIAISMEGILNKDREEKYFWTPIIFDLKNRLNSTWIFLTLIDDLGKTISPICLQLSNDIGKIQAKFIIKAVDQDQAPDLAWSMPILPVKHAHFALENPQIQIPMHLLDSFYSKNSSFVISCSTHNNFRSSTKIINVAPNPSITPEASCIPTDISSAEQHIQNLTVRSAPAYRPSSPAFYADLPATETIVFNGIKCDICKQVPVSIRYKCLQCSDFDLCSSCMNHGKHNHHVFAIIQNLKQQSSLRKVLKSKNFKSYLASAIPLQNVVTVEAELGCTSCAINSSKWICLQCKPPYGYCDTCWLRSANGGHAEDHFFALVNNTRNANLVLCYLKYCH